MTSEFQSDCVQPVSRAVDAQTSITPTNEHMVNATEMREFFQQNKRVLDKDQNGFVNLEELDAFKYTNGKDYRTIQDLKKYLPDISVMSNDEWGGENSGISDEDIVLYEVENDPGFEDKAERAGQFAGLVKQQFRFFDRDNSGTISIEELNARKSSNYLDPESQQAANFVFRNFDAVRVLDGKNNNGISKESLARVREVMLSPWYSARKNGERNMQQVNEESRLAMWRSLGGAQK
jgi:Ca2+-binding EF-hand superfamily protein